MRNTSTALRQKSIESKIRNLSRVVSGKQNAANQHMNSKAFAFVEMLVIIAIISVIAAIVVPTLVSEVEPKSCNITVTGLFTFNDGLYVATDKGVYALPVNTVEKRTKSIQIYGSIVNGQKYHIYVLPESGFRRTAEIIKLEPIKLEEDT